MTNKIVLAFEIVFRTNAARIKLIFRITSVERQAHSAREILFNTV